jgi:hypothetical protein
MNGVDDDDGSQIDNGPDAINNVILDTGSAT